MQYESDENEDEHKRSTQNESPRCASNVLKSIRDACALFSKTDARVLQDEIERLERRRYVLLSCRLTRMLVDTYCRAAWAEDTGDVLRSVHVPSSRDTLPTNNRYHVCAGYSVFPIVGLCTARKLLSTTLTWNDPLKSVRM